MKVSSFFPLPPASLWRGQHFLCLFFSIILFGDALLSLPARAEDRLRVAFVGDSIADGYWDGVLRLVDQDACLKKRLELLRLHKDSTGLLRNSRYDWPNEIKRIDGRYRPSIFVFSIGANDASTDERYRDRINALIDSASNITGRLLWVGLPSMRAPGEDKDARAKNKLFEDAIIRRNLPKIEYVRPWRLRDVEEDKFSSYGPDQSQNMVQLRTSDGVHFTFAGNLLTAKYLLPRIVSALERDGQISCGRTEALAK